jgi:cell division protein FtsQ
MWSRVRALRPQPKAMADACGRALRRSLPAIAAMCALAVIGGGLWLGYRFVTSSPRFAIEEIQIHGAHRLSVDELRDALPVHAGDNVFSADLADLGDRLRHHAWIASAEAKRILPHTIVIEIREHEPVAIVELGEGYLVDASGRPFKRIEPGDPTDLPLVSGIDRAAFLRDPAATAQTIVGALAVLARWRDPSRPDASEVHVAASGALALRASGVSIELPPGTVDLGERLRTFDAAWAALAEGERQRASTIHLHARVDQVTVAFKD